MMETRIGSYLHPKEHNGIWCECFKLEIEPTQTEEEEVLRRDTSKIDRSTETGTDCSRHRRYRGTERARGGHQVLQPDEAEQMRHRAEQGRRPQRRRAHSAPPPTDHRSSQVQKQERKRGRSRQTPPGFLFSVLFLLVFK